MAKKRNPPSANGEAKRSAPVGAEDIIRAWQTSSTIDEAMEKLDGRVKKTSLNSRIYQMRRRGIGLKKMPGSRSRRYSKEYINELSELADSLL